MLKFQAEITNMLVLWQKLLKFLQGDKVCDADHWAPEVSNLWIAMKSYMLKYSSEQINFQIDTVLWNRIIHQLIGHITYFICLVIKHFIYRQRCLKKGLSVDQCEDIEKYYLYHAVKHCTLGKHYRKWCGKPVNS